MRCLRRKQHARGVRTVSKPRTAPPPVFRIFTQARFHRIAFYISHGVLEVTLIANITVKWLILPELTGALQDLIALMSCEAFPRMNDFAHLEFTEWSKKRVDVVGHYAPGV